ncbi:hypothetical protein HDU76_001834, partial [Blyttiomyces sp. JEL0837]
MPAFTVDDMMPVELRTYPGILDVDAQMEWMKMRKEARMRELAARRRAQMAKRVAERAAGVLDESDEERQYDDDDVDVGKNNIDKDEKNINSHYKHQTEKQCCGEKLQGKDSKEPDVIKNDTVPQMNNVTDSPPQPHHANMESDESTETLVQPQTRLFLAVRPVTKPDPPESEKKPIIKASEPPVTNAKAGGFSVFNSPAGNTSEQDINSDAISLQDIPIATTTASSSPTTNLHEPLNETYIKATKTSTNTTPSTTSESQSSCSLTPPVSILNPAITRSSTTTGKSIEDYILTKTSEYLNISSSEYLEGGSTDYVFTEKFSKKKLGRTLFLGDDDDDMKFECANVKKQSRFAIGYNKIVGKWKEGWQKSKTWTRR